MFRFLPALLLSGCTTLTPAAIGALSGFDPLAADPGGYEVALHLPDGLEVTEATLTLAARRSDTGEDVAGTYALVQAPAPSAAVAAPPPPEGGRAAYFRLDPADLPEIRGMQTRIAGWKDVAPDTTRGSLSVSLTGCTTGDGPADGARGAVFLRAGAEAAFIPVVRPTEVDTLLDATGGTAPCPSTAMEP